METKPKTRHPEIAMLISRNKWRTVKLRAKGSDEGLAIAAVDALFYTGRFRELNNVIAHRLDDPALRNSDESNAIVKHILERLVEIPENRIPSLLTGENLQRIDSSSELSRYFCSLLRVDGSK